MRDRALHAFDHLSGKVKKRHDDSQKHVNACWETQGHFLHIRTMAFLTEQALAEKHRSALWQHLLDIGLYVLHSPRYRCPRFCKLMHVLVQDIVHSNKDFDASAVAVTLAVYSLVAQSSAPPPDTSRRAPETLTREEFLDEWRTLLKAVPFEHKCKLVTALAEARKQLPDLVEPSLTEMIKLMISQAQVESCKLSALPPDAHEREIDSFGSFLKAISETLGWLPREEVRALVQPFGSLCLEGPGDHLDSFSILIETADFPLREHPGEAFPEERRSIQGTFDTFARELKRRSEQAAPAERTAIQAKQMAILPKLYGYRPRVKRSIPPAVMVHVRFLGGDAEESFDGVVKDVQSARRHKNRAVLIALPQEALKLASEHDPTGTRTVDGSDVVVRPIRYYVESEQGSSGSFYAVDVKVSWQDGDRMHSMTAADCPCIRAFTYRPTDAQPFRGAGLVVCLTGDISERWEDLVAASVPDGSGILMCHGDPRSHPEGNRGEPEPEGESTHAADTRPGNS